MKGLIFTIALFSILINFSVAIMIDLVPAFNGMDVKIGLENSAGYIDDNTISDEFGNPVQAYQTAEDSSTANRNTLLDRVGLGLISNLLNFLNKYLFGFIEILRAIFGTHVSPIVFSMFKSIIILLYAIAAIELFTGKRMID